jgi:hypothetical protein
MSGNRIACYLVSLFLIAVANPAFAGKDKTEMAWKYAYNDVSGSVSDATAQSRLSGMNAKMVDGYGNLSRGKFYALASEMFDNLLEITEKHGGKKIYKPEWLD